jgi:hypothetical protein
MLQQSAMIVFIYTCISLPYTPPTFRSSASPCVSYEATKWGPVRIQVRIGPLHPLANCKRRLNGAVLRIRPGKSRSLVTAVWHDKEPFLPWASSISLHFAARPGFLEKFSNLSLSFILSLRFHLRWDFAQIAFLETILYKSQLSQYFCLARFFPLIH